MTGTAALLQDRPTSVAPNTIARLAAVFFLLTMVGGIVAQMAVSDRLVVAGDAAATAANIRANEGLFRLGFSIYVAEMICQVVMIGLYWALLRPAGPVAARIAAMLGVTGVAIKTMARAFFLAPLTILGGAGYLAAFDPPQLEAIASLALSVNDQAPAIALAFFGAESLIQGVLILRSTYLPSVLGVLSMLGGIGWLTFIVPPLGMRLFPVVALVGLAGALASIGWLLVKGVDEVQWREMARAVVAS